MDALPCEVREALGRMSAIKTPMRAVLDASYISSAGGLLLSSLLGEDDVRSRNEAAQLAAACIRMVEYLNQDWP